jgi:hypothetical protein
MKWALVRRQIATPEAWGVLANDCFLQEAFLPDNSNFFLPFFAQSPKV